MRIIDVASRSLVVVDPRTQVAAAEGLARRRGVRHLLVISDSALVGVACVCDLGDAADDAAVADCMASPVVTIGPDASIDEAAAVMRDRGVGCLPIVVEGALCAIVTRADLRRAGLPDGDAPIGPRPCACCGSHRHVRVDERGALCDDCRERGAPSVCDKDTGNGD